MTHEAFVYMWVNLTHRKRYIGYHKGSEKDKYKCSAAEEFFRDKYSSSITKRRTIARGTHAEMINLEYEILRKIDAKNNPKYYNKYNGGIIPERLKMSKKIDYDLVDKLIKNLDNRETIKLKTKDVRDTNRQQTRDTKCDLVKVDRIAESIEVAGHPNNTNPIRMVKYEDGTLEIVDGNNTIEAIYKLKIPEVSVQIIKFEEFDNNISNVHDFGNTMNYVEDHSTGQNKEDIKQVITLAIENGINVTETHYRDRLVKTTGRSASSIGALISAAKNKASTAPFELLDRDKLKAYVKELQEAKPDTVVQFSGSGSNAEYRVIGTIMRDMMKTGKTKGLAIIHHTSKKDEDNFNYNEMRDTLAHHDVKIAIEVKTHV